MAKINREFRNMNVERHFSFRRIRKYSGCLLLSAAALFTMQAEAGALRKADVIAVYFTANWCQPCKPFTALLEDVGNRFDGTPMLGIVFDYTNRSTREDAEMHASALGLQRLWQKNGDRLGMVYLLDARNKKILASITPDDDFDAIVKQVDSAMEQVSKR